MGLLLLQIFQGVGVLLSSPGAPWADPDGEDTCQMLWPPTGGQPTTAHGQIQPATYFCFIGSQPHPFIYLLSMAAFMPQLQN